MGVRLPGDRTTRDGDHRLVAIRPGALGDALITLPVLTWLRRKRSGLHITLVTRHDVLSLARSCGAADDVSPYDDPMWSALFADGLPARQGQASEICFGARVVAWTGPDDGATRRNLLAMGASAAVVAPGKPHTSSERHTALQLCDALAQLGYPTPDTLDDLAWPTPLLRPTEESRAHVASWLRDRGIKAKRLIAVHPGSGGEAKRWPPSSFAALLERLYELKYRPFLVEGPADAEVVSQVRHACRLPDDALPVARGLSIEALAGVLAQCGGYVGNDSGVTHLAAQTGCPTVAIFGPSDPAIWRPLGRKVVVNRAATGRIEDVSVDWVVATLEALLSNDEWSPRHRALLTEE